MMADIPDCNRVFANEYGTTVFLKNVVKATNIEVGDYTYYDDAEDPTAFEKRCVLFNYPEFFPEKLIIGKFCAIAQGVQFMIGAANHRLNSLSTYPFNVMGGLWREKQRRTSVSFPPKETLSSVTTFGSDAKQKFCPVSESETERLSEPMLSLPKMYRPRV